MTYERAKITATNVDLRAELDKTLLALKEKDRLLALAQSSAVSNPQTQMTRVLEQNLARNSMFMTAAPAIHTTLVSQGVRRTSEDVEGDAAQSNSDGNSDEEKNGSLAAELQESLQASLGATKDIVSTPPGNLPGFLNYKYSNLRKSISFKPAQELEMQTVCGFESITESVITVNYPKERRLEVMLSCSLNVVRTVSRANFDAGTELQPLVAVNISNINVARQRVPLSTATAGEVNILPLLVPRKDSLQDLVRDPNPNLEPTPEPRSSQPVAPLADSPPDPQSQPHRIHPVASCPMARLDYLPARLEPERTEAPKDPSNETAKVKETIKETVANTGEAHAIEVHKETFQPTDNDKAPSTIQPIVPDSKRTEPVPAPHLLQRVKADETKETTSAEHSESSKEQRPQPVASGQRKLSKDASQEIAKDPSLGTDHEPTRRSIKESGNDPSRGPRKDSGREDSRLERSLLSSGGESARKFSIDLMSPLETRRKPTSQVDLLKHFFVLVEWMREMDRRDNRCR